MVRLSKITATPLDCAVKGIRAAEMRGNGDGRREDDARRGGFRAFELG
jgi:hypothetical protein